MLRLLRETGMVESGNIRIIVRLGLDKVLRKPLDKLGIEQLFFEMKVAFAKLRRTLGSS